MKRNFWIVLGLISIVAIALIAFVFAGPSEKAEYVGVKSVRYVIQRNIKPMRFKGMRLPGINFLLKRKRILNV